MRRETEVLVVGGGPAGLAAAIAARKKGLHVTVVDGAKPPIDKACGEGLLPGTLAAIRQLGMRLDASDGRVFRGVRFLDEATSVEARFSGEGGLGVRRTLLHQKMVDYAAFCGAEILWQTHVSGIMQGGAIVGGRKIQSQWIIGADGIHSRVRRWCGLDSGTLRNVRFAQRRHYRVKPWTDCVEVYWGRRMQAYVTPLANDETCVVLISRDPRMRFADALQEFPSLASSLDKAELSSVQRGAVTAMCRVSRVYRGNVALIGDASGSVDAITGEGLGLGFRQALALADALKTGELEHYQIAHRQLAQRPNTIARMLLLLDRFAPLRKRVFRGLARDPQLFNGMLNVPAEEPSRAFLTETGARLGWRLLTT
ncbi:MAG TPA: NAD(P)/FAD-dependent oxidoreductase [Candidatus Angelobacter sp.]|nr:NAD(P)/FAD-dependent oxidoreductase [Candidatus Angelobacter sp.]